MLSIIGLVIIIVATIQVYKTAKRYERNAVGWALLTFGIGFGLQIILPLLIGIIIGVVMMTNGSTPEQMQEAITVPATILGIVCIILSVAAVLLILHFLSKVPEDKPFTPPPAPPENFG